LNEESVIRNERALTLEQEQNGLKDERDVLAEEASRLRARVAQLERYELECERMGRLLHQREAEEMVKAEDALRSRDQTIRDVSGKLASALDELEVERAQRQRRQIIFPVNDITLNGPPKR
jgi:phosphoenolpyruvate-protein kinase (PTS system EI component)